MPSPINVLSLCPTARVLEVILPFLIDRIFESFSISIILAFITAPSMVVPLSIRPLKDAFPSAVIFPSLSIEKLPKSTTIFFPLRLSVLPAIILIMSFAVKLIVSASISTVACFVVVFPVTLSLIDTVIVALPFLFLTSNSMLFAV